MGTSTGDIAHGADETLERTESGHGELTVTAEDHTNDRAEITTNALQNGKSISSKFVLFFISFSFVDELADEREEGGEEDAAGEQ